VGTNHGVLTISVKGSYPRYVVMRKYEVNFQFTNVYAMQVNRFHFLHLHSSAVWLGSQQMVAFGVMKTLKFRNTYSVFTLVV